MDFSAIPRPAFGRHAQHAEDKAPGVHQAKAVARRAMMFREARELLSALPGPGEAVHAIMTGRYDLCCCWSALLDLHPRRAAGCGLRPCAITGRNAVELLGLLEAGKIGGLTLLASTSSGEQQGAGRVVPRRAGGLPRQPDRRGAVALQGRLFRLRRRGRAGFGGDRRTFAPTATASSWCWSRPRLARFPRRMDRRRW